jgi:hypothetical protein
MTKSALICVVVILGLVTLATGQQALQETTVKMSGKTVTLKYSAPSMGGRKIFGGVVPFNQVWRAGAGAAAFHTDADLEVQGLSVPKGDYTLFVLPDRLEWQLIISRQTGAQAARFNSDMELGRVPMDMKKAGAPIENLKITMTSFGSVAGKLEIGWETTIASVPFNLDVVKANREW